MLLVGESINSTRKAVREAVIAHEEAFIIKLAKGQIEAGADFLDVNAGTGHGDQEPADLVWLTQVVQNNVDVPLCLDSSDPNAIKEAMNAHNGTPLINSISGEKEKMTAMLPVVSSGPCKIIGLCIGNNGIPNTADERLDIAKYLVSELSNAGVKREDIYLDPIVLSIGTESGAGLVTLDTISLIKKELPGVQTILAVSNVGFGLPGRFVLNRMFAAFAVERGMNALLTDVRDKGMISSYVVTEALLGRDSYCMNYLKAYRAGKVI
jgi:cobalamin-dependent methionine synthase I